MLSLLFLQSQNWLNVLTWLNMTEMNFLRELVDRFWTSPPKPRGSNSGVKNWCVLSKHTLWWTNIAMENHHVNRKIHYKLPFSIAILVHQRVFQQNGNSCVKYITLWAAAYGGVLKWGVPQNHPVVVDDQEWIPWWRLGILHCVLMMSMGDLQDPKLEVR